MAEVLPLSAAQAGIWAGQQLDRDSPIYNAAEYVELRGALDADRFAAALRQAVGDAEALHARFTGDGQVIEHRDWPLHRIDVGTRAEALEWMRTDLAVPTDLTAGPLFTQALLRVDPQTHLWYQRIHHIAADGYAFAMIARRVADIYSGRPGRFGPLRPVLDEDAAYNPAADRAFWHEYMAGAPAPVTLARLVPMEHSVRRHTVRLEMTELRPERVLAAVAALLHRHTGADEVVLGLPVAGRFGSAALRVPCMAMNIVPVRIPVTAGSTLDDVAAIAAGQLRTGRRHHRYRYEQLRRDLGLVGGQKRLFGPVVNIMPFDYRLEFDGVSARSHNLSAGPVEDLSIAVYDRGDGPHLDLDANPSAYAAGELAGHAAALAELLSADPSEPVAPITVLDGGPLPREPRPVTELIAEVPGDRTAIVDGSRRITYAELLAGARACAAELAAQGAGPGTVVAIALPRGIPAVTAMLGTLLAGAAYLPLDPDGPVSRNAEVIEDAGAAVVITAAGIERRPARPHAPDLAYVIYTSGSTGRPNGVAVGRAALAHFVAGATHRYGITAGDRVLQFAPLHFDASVEEIFLTLCEGATLIVRTDEMMQSIPDLFGACEAGGVTVLDLPTAFWHEVAYAVGSGVRLPASVRTVIIGGEAALAERVARWHAAVGAGVRLINTYGPTEATVVATTADLEPGDEDVPIGTPLPGVRCALVHGELYLLGGGLARGYLNDGAPERFTDLDGDPAYRTGDRVRLRGDGQLLFAGRIDDEFKISGHRVDPAEVESVLLRHPAVREAAVVGQTMPGGTKRLIAHVVGDACGHELRAHARRALPAAMVPSAYVLAARLPRTPNGKVDRAALRDASPTGRAEAATDTERRVLAVWQEILGGTVESTEDDFFALGGQSLQTIQVANRLSVPVATVFANPTVATLAAALDGAGESSADFHADAVLPTDVQPGPVPGSGRVLLTGATGFVGTHLLVELLAATPGRVVCVVRGDGARDRVRRALADRGLSADLDRVDIVPDFSAPVDVDAVYHSAAVVSVVRGYRSMRPVNVDATRELLRRGVPFHHISTLAVATSAGWAGAHPGLRDGYQQSKWVAERLVQQAAERGLPAAVYRLGRVVGPAATGYVNPDDLIWRILRAGVPRGVLPDLGVAEPWTPADYVARSVVALSLRGATGVHNLAPTPLVRFADVAHWVRSYGFPVTVLPVPEWVAEVRDGASDADKATLAFFDGDAAAPVADDLESADSGIPCPVIDQALMHRYLDHAVKNGVLPNARNYKENA